MERGTMGKSGRRGNNEGSNPIQRADGRWQINIRYTDESGNSHRRSVSGRTAQEVRTKRDALRKRITAGQPASDSSAPVSTFVESWVASTLAVSSRKQSTKLLYGTVARKHISDTALGRTRLSRVKPSTVEAWLVEVRGRGLSDSTVRTCYTVLRAVFDTAVRDEAVATNPVAKIPRPPVRKKEAACLSASEAADLLESARDSRYAPLFRFLVNTATRRGEALALQWSGIDFTKKLIHVRHTLARVDGVLQRIDPKSIKSRRVIPGYCAR